MEVTAKMNVSVYRWSFRSPALILVNGNLHVVKWVFLCMASQAVQFFVFSWRGFSSTVGLDLPCVCLCACAWQLQRHAHTQHQTASISHGIDT